MFLSEQIQRYLTKTKLIKIIFINKHNFKNSQMIIEMVPNEENSLSIKSNKMRTENLQPIRLMVLVTTVENLVALTGSIA